MVNLLNLEIFNPPEENINFDSFIKLPVFLFRLLWFDFKPLIEGATFRQKLLNFAKNVYVKICILGLALAMLSEAGYGIEHNDDFVSLTSAISQVLTVIVVMSKPLTVYIFKDDIWQVFQDFQNVFGQHVNQNKKYGVKKYLDAYHFYMKIYIGIMITISLPVAFPGISFLIDGSMKLSVLYWFPFDAFKPETFPIVIVWTDWIAWNILTYISATDSLLCVLVTFISMEFDILKIDLLNLNSTPRIERARKIQDLIDKHNKLLNLSGKLQKLYSIVFLASFVASSMIMCIIAFRLVVSEADTFVYAFYIPYMAMIAGPILFMCYYGQKLIDASESIAYGVYNCGWETFDDNYAVKQLVLIILRSQRAKRLTAMKFADVSLKTFTTVRF